MVVKTGEIARDGLAFSSVFRYGYKNEWRGSRMQKSMDNRNLMGNAQQALSAKNTFSVFASYFTYFYFTYFCVR